MDSSISSCQPVSTEASSVISTLKQLSKETREFICDPIDVLDAPVDACTFLRQYVATNTPVLIKGATDHWAATELWSKDYLESKIGSQQVSVELTPNGFGDAVTPCRGQPGHCFCMPHSARMRFDEFTTMFFQSKQQEEDLAATSAAVSGVPYLSVSTLKT
jgi:jumonji domain-containing protein 7